MAIDFRFKSPDDDKQKNDGSIYRFRVFGSGFRLYPALKYWLESPIFRFGLRRIRRFKTKYIVYPLLLTIMLGVPLVRYFTVTQGESDCMVVYTENLKDSNFRGYMYDIEGQRHIEPGNSTMVSGLTDYQVGLARGCVMVSNNVFVDMNNTFYCSVTYIMEQAREGKLKTEKPTEPPQ